MENKKKKLNIFWKILIIICLFVLAGVGGYVYGMITDKPVKETKQEVKKTSSEKKQVLHHRMNQNIKLSNGVILKIESLDRYKQIEGLKNAVGIKLKITNNTKEKKTIPYKYAMSLLFDDKQLSSTGIYYADKLAHSELVSVPEKIKPKETSDVVYLYKANKAEDLNAYKAELKIKDENKTHIVSLRLDKEQFSKPTKTKKVEKNSSKENNTEDYNTDYNYTDDNNYTDYNQNYQDNNDYQNNNDVNNYNQDNTNYNQVDNGNVQNNQGNYGNNQNDNYYNAQGNNQYQNN